MILDCCELEESEYALPPNPKALWCRINNLIETEIAPELKKEAAIKEEQKRRRWQFSRRFGFHDLAAPFDGQSGFDALSQTQREV